MLLYGYLATSNSSTKGLATLSNHTIATVLLGLHGSLFLHFDGVVWYTGVYHGALAQRGVADGTEAHVMWRLHSTKLRTF